MTKNSSKNQNNAICQKIASYSEASIDVLGRKFSYRKKDFDFEKEKDNWANLINNKPIGSFEYPVSVLLRSWMEIWWVSFLTLSFILFVSTMGFIDDEASRGFCFIISILTLPVLVCLFPTGLRKFDKVIRIIIIDSKILLTYISGRTQEIDFFDINLLKTNELGGIKGNIISFKKGPVLRYLDTLSYWPLLQNILEEKLDKEKNYKLKTTKDGNWKSYTKIR